jgi:hypothetical protein
MPEKMDIRLSQSKNKKTGAASLWMFCPFLHLMALGRPVTAGPGETDHRLSILKKESHFPVPV